MKLSASILRHSATIEQENSVSDGMGGRTLAWSTYVTVRVSSIDLAGREGYLHGRLEAPAYGTCYIRYQHGKTITPAMRLVCNGVAYQIRSVVDVETRHRWIKLNVESGVVL